MDLNNQLDDLFSKIVTKKKQNKVESIGLFKKLEVMIKKDYLTNYLAKIASTYDLEELFQEPIKVEFNKDGISCMVLISTEPVINFYIKGTIRITIHPSLRKIVIQSFLENTPVFQCIYSMDNLRECLKKTSVANLNYTIDYLNYMVTQIEECNILDECLQVVSTKLSSCVND